MSTTCTRFFFVLAARSLYACSETRLQTRSTACPNLAPRLCSFLHHARSRLLHAWFASRSAYAWLTLGPPWADAWLTLDGRLAHDRLRHAPSSAHACRTLSSRAFPPHKATQGALPQRQALPTTAPCEQARQETTSAAQRHDASLRCSLQGRALARRGAENRQAGECTPAPQRHGFSNHREVGNTGTVTRLLEARQGTYTGTLIAAYFLKLHVPAALLGLKPYSTLLLQARSAPHPSPRHGWLDSRSTFVRRSPRTLAITTAPNLAPPSNPLRVQIKKRQPRSPSNPFTTLRLEFRGR